MAGVASGLSSPDTTSDDLDIVFVDGSGNLKYIDSDGNVADTGAQGRTVGGAGDIDGDGDVDVTFVDTNDNLKYVDAAGNIVDTGVDNVAYAGAVTDWDGDNDLDIVYVTKSNDLRAVDNNGNTIFTGISTAARVGGAGDFDGDADPEVVYTIKSSNSNDNIAYANADGSTGSTNLEGRDIGGVIDFDDDGSLEILYEYDNGGSTLRAGETDGSATDLTTDLWGGVGVGGAGDIDADGNEEAAYIDGGGTINYIEGDGSGNTDLGVSADRIGAVVDFDSDGDYDDAPTTSNADPDGTTVSSNPVTLSVDVSDPEFAIGDSATVNISHEGMQVHSETISSAQTVSTEVQDVQERTRSWSVTVTDSEGNQKSNFYSYTADYSSPALSNPDPTGNISSYDGTISVDVSDADFDDDAGDTVTVSAVDGDGFQIGSKTVSTNTTVSLDYSVTSGSNSINWTATDSHGASDTLSQSFTAPDQLTIYNESEPTQKITGANLTAKFYFRSSDPQIVEKNASDGTVSLGGVPADEAFVVVVEADGYITRRVVFASLIDQQSVFLLPTNRTTTDVVFTVEDYSGDYPQQSTALLVQRGLNGSWQTVTGDYFGATGEFPAQLRFQERHRLVLVNLDTGDRRIAGSYTPLRASGQTIQVTTQGEIDLSGAGLNIAVSPGTRTLTNTSSETITVEIDTNDATLQNATLKAVYRPPDHSTSTVLASQTVASTGEYQLSVDLRGRAGGTVDVVVDYETDTLSTSEIVTYTIRRAFENQHSLLAVLASVAPRFPAGHVEAFQSIIVLFTTVLGTAATASGFRGASTELVGLVAVVILGAWGVIGWIDYGIVFAAGVTWVALAATRRGL